MRACTRLKDVRSIHLGKHLACDKLKTSFLLAQILSIDESVELMIRYLRKHRLYEDTIIIFLSDVSFFDMPFNLIMCHRMEDLFQEVATIHP